MLLLLITLKTIAKLQLIKPKMYMCVFNFFIHVFAQKKVTTFSGSSIKNSASVKTKEKEHVCHFHQNHYYDHHHDAIRGSTSRVKS